MSYRAKYGIPRTQPLSAKATTQRRREIAQSIHPWEKVTIAQAAPEPEAAAKPKSSAKKKAPAKVKAATTRKRATKKARR